MILLYLSSCGSTESINTNIAYNPAHDSNIKQMMKPIKARCIAFMLINLFSLIISAGKRETSNDFREIEYDDVQRRYKQAE